MVNNFADRIRNNNNPHRRCLIDLLQTERSRGKDRSSLREPDRDNGRIGVPIPRGD